MNTTLSRIEVSLIGITTIGLNFSSSNPEIASLSIRAVEPDYPQPLINEGERVFGPIEMMHTDLVNRKISKFVFGAAWAYVQAETHTVRFCFMDSLPGQLPTFAIVQESMRCIQLLSAECLWVVSCFRFPATSSLEFFFSEPRLFSDPGERRLATEAILFCEDDGMIKVSSLKVGGDS